MSDEALSDYTKYRGKCKEMSEQFVKERGTLARLVRGYYHCPIWGKQEHWWAEELVNGYWYIVDLTVKQFPTHGKGATYEEFNGVCECANCGKEIPEEEARIYSNYAFCSGQCTMRFVGL